MWYSMGGKKHVSHSARARTVLHRMLMPHIYGKWATTHTVKLYTSNTFYTYIINIELYLMPNYILDVWCLFTLFTAVSLSNVHNVNLTYFIVLCELLFIVFCITITNQILYTHIQYIWAENHLQNLKSKKKKNNLKMVNDCYLSTNNKTIIFKHKPVIEKTRAFL